MTEPIAYEKVLAWRAVLDEAATASKAGDRQLAETKYQTALRLSSALSDQELVTSLIHLADFLSAAKEFARAEPLYRQAAEIYDRSFGPHNFIAAMCWNSLSSVLKALGKDAEAEAVKAKASRINR